LIFVTIKGLGDIRRKYQPGLVSNLVKEMEGKFDKNFYSVNKGNIIFIPVESDAPEIPFNIYTAGVGAVMLDNAARFKDAIVYELGAGAGILSLIALSLGASKAVLVENNKSEIEMAVALLTAHGYRENVDYYIIDEDLTKPAKVISKLPDINPGSKTVIGLVDIGSWTAGYSKANSSSLGILTWLNAGLIINGGFYTTNSQEHGYHIKGLNDSRTFLENNHFNVEELSFLNSKVLTATTPSVDQAMITEQRKIREEIFGDAPLSEQAKHEIRALFPESMLKDAGWSFDNIDEIPVVIGEVPFQSSGNNIGTIHQEFILNKNNNSIQVFAITSRGEFFCTLGNLGEKLMVRKAGGLPRAF
jgi:hypothetical protein